MAEREMNEAGGRSLTLQELLAASSWYGELGISAKARISDETHAEDVPQGNALWRAGEIPRNWYGVLDGLLSVSMLTVEGGSVSYGAISVGSWFGEAGIVRGVPRHEEILALSPSRVAVMPYETFDWLFRSEITFCQFLVRQISERLYWSMGGHASHKHLNADGHVVRALVGLYHPRLYPMMERTIRISQESIANMAGLSRSRCNEALGRLQKAGLIQLDYKGITVLELDALRKMMD